ncbi:30 kDa heat shock protein [Colletotrichum chlorophyti]|uniref:30 kDa heat shock protein n=1 Tax=Colletotrichum chlorophyti TaxID=708187 RepID=A0A1Q8S344_9PEZI|nr:30 kDa heat shock protein [Colletotrichum chlorophyti]
MAFFPRNLYNSSDASFTPLFRLLEDFDNYSRQGGQTTNGSRGQANRTSVPTFQPKFDVREVEDAYELHGELPGMNKEDVSIEFTDAHTLHIRGRVERSYTSGTPPAGLIQNGKESSGAITDGSEKSRSAHQATVEDDRGDDTTVAESKKDGQQQQQQQPADNAKYWVSERSVGEFSRVFNFPGQIQQDAVTAGFKDGILSIRVPKARKHETRRIQIN